MPYGDRRGGFRGGFRDNRRNFPQEKHKIKCSDCGEEAEVPFKPRKDSPVYCRECFFKRKGIKPRKESVKQKDEESEESKESNDLEEYEDDDSEDKESDEED